MAPAALDDPIRFDALARAKLYSLFHCEGVDKVCKSETMLAYHISTAPYEALPVSISRWTGEHHGLCLTLPETSHDGQTTYKTRRRCRQKASLAGQRSRGDAASTVLFGGHSVSITKSGHRLAADHVRNVLALPEEVSIGLPSFVALRDL